MTSMRRFYAQQERGCDMLAPDHDYVYEEEWHRTDDAIKTPEKPCTTEADQVKETPEES
jgi:hypothetical protein